MLAPLRSRFGIPGVISVLALAFAMFGGAYAASSSDQEKVTASDSNAGGATASAKAKRGARGPKGEAGPAGPTGPMGATGATGPKGEPGADGTEGSEGPVGQRGPTGTGVFASNEPEGSASCSGRGGTKFITGATTTYACNGKEGAGGGGVPATLPAGKSETGTWWMVGDGETEFLFAPISFPIPLSEADAAGTQIAFWKEAAGKENPNCPGSTLNPKAEPGYLCVYFSKAHRLGTSGLNPEVTTPQFEAEGEEKVGPSGAQLAYHFSIGAYELIGGSFAVTAPSS